MMPQSSGGEVGKDHKDDSDPKATFSLGSNLRYASWFGESVTLALFWSPIISFSLQYFRFYLKDRNQVEEKLQKNK